MSDIGIGRRIGRTMQAQREHDAEKFYSSLCCEIDDDVLLSACQIIVLGGEFLIDGLIPATDCGDSFSDTWKSITVDSYVCRIEAGGRSFCSGEVKTCEGAMRCALSEFLKALEGEQC